MAMAEPLHEDSAAPPAATSIARVPTSRTASVATAAAAAAAIDHDADWAALSSATVATQTLVRKKQLAHQSSSKDLSDDVQHMCQCQPTPAESREFRKRWTLLTDHERTASLRGYLYQFLQTTSELIPCSGCRSSTEALAQKLMNGSCRPPALVANSGLCFNKDTSFQLNDNHMHNSDLALALFQHQERCGNAALAKVSRASSKSGGGGGGGGGASSSRVRCPLHAQRARGRPRPAAFETLWNKLSEEHQRHLSHIDSDQFLTDLENYLRRHRFCCRCKEKVLEAYDLLIGSSCSEDDCEDCAGFDCADKHHEHSDYGDELHYTSYLFDELTYSRTTSHIVVPCHIDFMAQLMARADQEIVGDWGDRHARTIAEAQDEVLICLGMVIWDKMQHLWTQLRTEKRSEELLVHCSVATLHRNFDVAVEALHGLEMMEQLLAEEDDESRRLAKKKEKKKEKKKKRKSATKQKADAAQAAATTTTTGNKSNGAKSKDVKSKAAAAAASAVQTSRKVPQTSRSSGSFESRSNSMSSQDDDNNHEPDSDSTNDGDDSSDPSSQQQQQQNQHQKRTSRPHRCTASCDDVCSLKTLLLDGDMEMQLLLSMGWDASNQFASSLPELDGDSDDEENYGIPEDEIEFWKQNRTVLVRKRLAQRQRLQEKFDQFVLRTNSLEATS